MEFLRKSELKGTRISVVIIARVRFPSPAALSLNPSPALSAKRLQRCSDGAGACSGGVNLVQPTKVFIFVPETSSKKTDSEVRLKYSLRILPQHYWGYLLTAPLT
jgi:hypothetical protein